MDELGPLRGVDVPFDGIGDWDPSAIPLPDGEMTSLKTSLAQSGHQPDPTVPELDPESKESQARYDPMNVDLGVIPEEEPREDEPEDEPEDELVEEPEEERIEGQIKSGDEDNPIKIEADSESSDEHVPDEDSNGDSEKSVSEWMPSRGRRD
ncbi:uncharacterized protein LOC130137074 [Syzygium oleosum]|uniref:uncharacterized protein LOC130137074 n=1 Tax=Syzygium oleosum TaxID=219896 RepID=UPI0024B9E0E8|nr:uncharacterized protein LOC130137074 [Syzygium oleosum]